MANVAIIDRNTYPFFKDQFTKLGSADLGKDPLTGDVYYTVIGQLYDGLYLILKKLEKSSYLTTIHKINLMQIKITEKFLKDNLFFYDIPNDDLKAIYDQFNFIAVCLCKTSSKSLEDFTFLIAVLNKQHLTLNIIEIDYYGNIIQYKSFPIEYDQALFKNAHTITLLRGKNFINKQLYIYLLFSFFKMKNNKIKVSSSLEIFNIGENKFSTYSTKGVSLKTLQRETIYQSKLIEWKNNFLENGVQINSFKDFWKKRDLIFNEEKNINNEINGILEKFEEIPKVFDIYYNAAYIDKHFVYNSLYSQIGNYAGVTTLIYNNYEGGFTIDYRNGKLYFTCQEPSEIYISYFTKQNYTLTDPEEDYYNGVNNAQKFIYDLTTIKNILPTIDPPNFIEYKNYMNIKIKTPMISIGPRRFILPHEIFESGKNNYRNFTYTLKDEHAKTML